MDMDEVWLCLHVPAAPLGQAWWGILPQSITPHQHLWPHTTPPPGQAQIHSAAADSGPLLSWAWPTTSWRDWERLGACVLIHTPAHTHLHKQSQNSCQVNVAIATLFSEAVRNKDCWHQINKFVLRPYSQRILSLRVLLWVIKSF